MQTWQAFHKQFKNTYKSEIKTITQKNYQKVFKGPKILVGPNGPTDAARENAACKSKYRLNTYPQYHEIF